MNHMTRPDLTLEPTDMPPCLPKFSAPLLVLLTVLLWGPAPAQAQMKIGRNPTVLATDANLHVEATDGSALVVRKSTPQLGVGTTNPGNRLEVDSGTSGASGMRLTRLPGAPLLGTNASGDVVSVSTAASCDCGDIKAGFQTASHGNWQLMNGSQTSTATCTVPALNVSNTLLVQGGSVGTTNAASGLNLARNQLPNVTLTNNTSTDGYHYHYLSTSSGVQSLTGGGSGGSAASMATGGSYRFQAAEFLKTAVDGGHRHSVTFAINGGVAQQPLTFSAAQLPRINVNYFVCVN